MWESLRTVTSYQDLDGVNVIPLLNEDNQTVFDLQGKCSILQTTFFSGQHLHNNKFNKDFKVSVENSCMRFSMKNSMMTFITLQPLTKT